MGDDESRTVVEIPSPRVRPSTRNIAATGTVVNPPRTPSGPSIALSKTSAISETAIEAVEAERMRGMMTGFAISSLITCLIVVVIGGDRDAQRIHAAALAASAISSAGFALLFRNPKRYSPRIAVNVFYGQICVLVTGYYFWGIFSTYGALVPLSVYVVCGSATRREAIALIGVLLVAQTTIMLATAFGWIESRGLVEPVLGRATLFTQIVAIVLFQVITLGSAIAGSAARRDSAKALDVHNQVLIELARREAQLAEANEDARAAREAGLGGIGRFTDQTIDGLKLGEVLGRGAMGEIYAAFRGDESTPLAVKILAPHLLRDPAARDRFLRESAMVSAVTSPNVVRVHGVSPAEAPWPYIVMERLEGTDLGQLIAQKVSRTVADIEQIAAHVAAGLDAAHAAGVIHRDLKPSNIFAVGEGAARTWKIIDFGASKWEDGEGTLTLGNIVGTPGYMAPEQARGGDVDARSDVYSLGVVLYRLLTGFPVVVPADVPVMLQEVAFRVPIQPSKRASVSPQIEAVLAIALAKSAANRFATASEVSRAFSQAVAGTLDPATARRAATLLAAAPWNSWTTG